MNEVSFREKINCLRTSFIEDRYNRDRSNDFWYIMDSISDELVLKWAERAVKVKNPIGENWTTDEWQKLCNILHYMKTYDKYKEMPWTQAQKRFCIFMIIKFWDDLEMSYFC